MNWLKMWAADKYFVRPLEKQYDDATAYDFGRELSVWLGSKFRGKRRKAKKLVIKSRVLHFLKGFLYEEKGGGQ